MTRRQPITVYFDPETIQEAERLTREGKFQTVSEGLRMFANMGLKVELHMKDMQDPAKAEKFVKEVEELRNRIGASKSIEEAIEGYDYRQIKKLSEYVLLMKEAKYQKEFSGVRR